MLRKVQFVAKKWIANFDSKYSCKTKINSVKSTLQKHMQKHQRVGKSWWNQCFSWLIQRLIKKCYVLIFQIENSSTSLLGWSFLLWNDIIFNQNPTVRLCATAQFKYKGSVQMVLNPSFQGTGVKQWQTMAPTLHILYKWLWTGKDVVWQHLKQATWQYHEWSKADISLIGMLL